MEEIYREQTPEVFNRRIRLVPFTYEDALKIAHNCVKRELERIELVDTHSQDLGGDYKLTLQALEQLYFVEPEKITNHG